MAVDVTQPVFPPTTRTPITSQWGGAVSESVIQRFTSVADRDAKWLSPPLGSMCVTTDTLTLWMWNGSAWTYPGSRGVVGYAQITADTAALSALTVIPGLSISFTAMPGRRYSFRLKCEVVQTVGSDVYVINLENGITTLQRLVDCNQHGSAATKQVEYVNNSSISGSLTWKINMIRASGTGTVKISAGTTKPAFIVIEDIGALV